MIGSKYILQYQRIEEAKSKKEEEEKEKQKQ